MNIDAYSMIGKPHRGAMCQDYYRKGTTRSGISYFIVCDGCSSAPDTDVGARIIALAFERVINHDSFDENKFNNSMIWDAMTLAKENCLAMHLNIGCLEATALVAAFFPETQTICHIACGDGFIFWKEKDKAPELCEISFAQNAPYYPILFINAEQYHCWRKLYDKNDMTIKQGSEIKTSHPTIISCALSANNLEYFGMATDGCGSFVTNASEIISPEIIFKEVLDFPSYTGSFVQRSGNFLIKNHQKQGTVNNDDLTIAAMCFVKQGE